MYKEINGIQIQVPDIVRPTGKVAIYLNDAKTGKLKSYDFVDNMFVTSGKNALAESIRGTETNNKGIITYCAVGTDATAPALSDILLGTELDRKLISTREISAGALNAAVFTTFYNTSEANGTLVEAGLFGDAATASVDTGTLFSKVAINRTKSSNDTLTIEWTIIIG